MDNQQEFLESLGLTKDGEVPSIPTDEDTPRLDAHPDGSGLRSPVADLEGLPDHILKECHLPVELFADIPGAILADREQARQEVARITKALFDQHKAKRGDIRSKDPAADKTLKTSYNGWLHRLLNSAGKQAIQEHRATARATAKAAGTEATGELRRHIKQTRDENEQELITRVTQGVVEQLLPRIMQELERAKE